MKILITGKTGQLGQTFNEISLDYPEHNFTFVGREGADFERHSFDVIINCMAYTAVDKAESEAELAEQVNHQAVKQLAQIARQQHAKFIHISTDYVFDGDSDTPYLESDMPNPINTYAQTKLAGEQAIFDTAPTNALVIRTSWLYSEYGNNFLKTMLKLAQDKDELKIVADQIGTPTYAYDLATAILHIINSAYFAKNFATTTYHYTNTGECSWYDFAQEIFTLSHISCTVTPITTAEYPTPAKRPKYSVLSKDKIRATFDINISSWQSSLKATLDQSINTSATINLFQPALGNEELSLIKDVFASNWLGKGVKVKEFEENFAKELSSDSSHFLSTTSCTEAIFLSTKLFDFKQGDEIIVPAISFPSIGSAIVESGATMVFCDVGKHTLNVRAKDIQKVLSQNTKAVYITHYGGIPCDMDAIVSLCNNNNIRIIEDSACAVRSFYKGRACGTIGDMGMWSFDAMKTLSTADGGMMYIEDTDKCIEAEESLYLGLPVKSKSGLDSSSENVVNWWEFEMNRTGRRAIMNNVTAAMGLSQLDKLDGFINRRKDIHTQYAKALQNTGDIQLPPTPDFEHTSSYYFFWIQTKHRDQLAKFLLDKGVYTTFRYWPLHKIKLFSEYTIDTYPNSDYAATHTLNIPLHQSLSDRNVDLIINSIKEFYEQN